MKALVGIVAFAACAGHTVGPSVPVPRYAALFHAGQRWTYLFTHVVPAARTVEGRATCAVVEVRAFAGGVASRIACSPSIGVETPMTHDPVEGVWAADARGLWRLPLGLPASGAPTFDTADDAYLVLAASSTEACAVTEATTDGPYVRHELCFGDVGITEGDLEFRPGNDADIERLTFALARGHER